MSRAYPKLRERMKFKHVNQEDIAEELNRSRRYVNGCLNGETCFLENELYIIAEMLDLKSLDEYFNKNERAGLPPQLGNCKRYRLKNYEMADALIYKGNSLGVIANDCYLNRQTLLKLFRGEWVSLLTAETFAEYLNMDLGELFYERKYHDVAIS